MQPQFTINIPGVISFIILLAVLLLVLGFGEKSNLQKRRNMIGAGTILIGVVVILGPLSFYMYLITAVSLVLGVSDILLLSLSSVLGGAILAAGFMNLTRPVEKEEPTPF
ncbi:MAG: hypothetical protein GF309_15625 [Candidatus Lokiarchaeota archaeon]|nr:hypothetical protein [Candidatus Lokiarchaeota archaeon]